MTTDQVQTENKEVIKNTQVKSEVTPVTPVISESSPDIKTEENKVNWANFREERERERKARLEADRISEKRKLEADALRTAMEALVNKPTQQEHNDPYSNESDEQRVEKMVATALAKERQKYQEEQKIRDQEQLPKILKQNFKDFDQVCNSENLDYLEFHYPEVTAAFKYMPDGVEKWSSIYNTVKKFVPYSNKNSDSKRVEENMKKPQISTPAITDTQPKGSAWILSDERKKANWERMQKDRKSFTV